MNKILKKLKWAIPIFLFGIIFSIPSIKTKALTSDSFYYEWITPKVYVSKTKDGVERSERIRIYHRTSDGEVVYCIQPGVDFASGVLINGYDSNQASLASMSQETWNRINLLAYYGYGYGNHTDSKWYAITQYEIWKAYNLGWDVYWVDSFHGSKISQFETESQELLNLVNNHYKRPSFNNQLITDVVDNTITLTDTNNVLQYYDVSIDGDASYRKEGNILYITPNEIGNITINFSKKSNRLGRTSLAYVSDTAQNLLFAGNLDPVTASIKINSIGGKVTIHKVDKDTGLAIAQGDATLKGATYDIYKTDGTKVGTITTGNDGVITSGMLPHQGEYYLLEEKASTGYELDDKTKYYFSITSDDLYPEVTVYEKVIERDVNIFKVFATDKTGFLTGEPNVKFDIYLKSSGKKVASITTDEKGFASIKLPYGIYVIKQVTSSKDHYKVDDFEIVINEYTDDPYYKLLSNSEIKAKLKLIKIDSESGKKINMSGIKFKIFDVSKKEYVCQTITYPNAEKICEFETTNDGEFITPYALSSGKYILEEIDQKIDGYLWNTKPYEFEIGENSEVIYDNDYGAMILVKYANKQVKGRLTIKKTAEKLVIEDGSYHYEEIPLKDAEFGIYADEDIVTKDGVIHYKKNDLVATIKSDEEGLAELDDMYLGKYYVVETKVPNDKLVLDNTKYKFQLSYKDQYTEVILKSFDILNKYKKGTLEFTKTDVSTGKPLPNTTIEIYTNKDELIFTGVTDENGKIIINDLPVGDYYILEKNAPEGYKINPERQYFSIKENNEIVKATLADELIIEVPNTDAEFNYLIIVIPVLLLTTGIGMILYAKKRKNKSQSN